MTEAFEGYKWQTSLSCLPLKPLKRSCQHKKERDKWDFSAQKYTLVWGCLKKCNNPARYRVVAEFRKSHELFNSWQHRNLFQKAWPAYMLICYMHFHCFQLILTKFNNFTLYLNLQHHFLVFWYSQRYIWGRMQNELPGSEGSALIQWDFITYSNRILQSCKHDVFMGLGAVCGWDAWQTDLSEVEVTSHQDCPCSEFVNFYFSKRHQN